jgi:hypothetical protein
MILYAMRVTSLLGLLAAVLLAAGCASLPTPPPPIQTVEIPVAAPCAALAEVPPIAPVTPNAELRAMPPGRFVVALGADRAALLAWAQVADAAVRECAR